MNKYVALFLALFPMVAFGAPSVRMLGNKSTTTATLGTGTRVAPVKPSGIEGATMARVGSLRAKSKVNNTVSTTLDSPVTRFPVITSSHSYNVANTPKTGDTPTSVGYTNVDVDTIVNAVMNNIEGDYYNKNQVYDNDEFRQAVIETVPVVDDPRIDAIRIGSRPEHTSDLPSGTNYSYGYIWIEED